MMKISRIYEGLRMPGMFYSDVMIEDCFSKMHKFKIILQGYDLISSIVTRVYIFPSFRLPSCFSEIKLSKSNAHKAIEMKIYCF